MYKTAATIYQGAKTDTEAKFLKVKLPLIRTAPYKDLTVSLRNPADTPDGFLLGAKLIYFGCTLRNSRRGCSRALLGTTFQALCNPYNHGDIPKYLPAELTQYVLSNFSEKSPPCHVTLDDVSVPLQRLDVDKITGHQSVRGRGGFVTVMYETHWTGPSRPSWEWKMDLQLSRHEILRY